MDNGRNFTGFGGNFEMMGLDNERARMRVEEAGANLKPVDETVDQNSINGANVINAINAVNAANTVNAVNAAPASEQDLRATGNMAMVAGQKDPIMAANEERDRQLYGMPSVPQMGEIVDMSNGAEVGASIHSFNDKDIKTDKKGLTAKTVAVIDKEIDNLGKTGDAEGFYATSRQMMQANLRESYGREIGDKR